MIKQFDKANLDEIRSEMAAALKTVGEKFGVTFLVGGIRFQAYSFKASIDCATNVSENKTAGSENNDFAEIYGPRVGREYEIGDDRTGYMKVRVVSNARKKSKVIVTERIRFGSLGKCNKFAVGQTIKVPFIFFKGK